MLQSDRSYTDTGQLTQPPLMHTVTIERNDDGLFRVAGTAHWAVFCDAGLCAHDIFHHRPDDRGTMTDEAMTYGVELWLEHPDAGLEGICAHALTGVFEDDYERHPDDLGRYIIREKPPAHQALKGDLLERFLQVTDEGLRDAAWEIDRIRRKKSLPELSDSAMSEFMSDDNMNNYAAWMAYGYATAHERYPAPTATRDSFYRLMEHLQRWPVGLTSVTLDFGPGYETFLPREPLARTVWGYAPAEFEAELMPC